MSLVAKATGYVLSDVNTPAFRAILCMTLLKIIVYVGRLCGQRGYCCLNLSEIFMPYVKINVLT